MAPAASISSPSNSPPPQPPPKKQPPGPWSHTETVHLIEVYQEKWYALKRGQLKARHWEEVANSVSIRCGFDEPSKTSTQCRHKIEKLRKRYRTEKQRELACGNNGDACNRWVYYQSMDQMEKGIFHAPRLARNPPPPPPPPLDRVSDTTDNDADKNTRSLHRLLGQTGNQVPLLLACPSYSSFYKKNDRDFRFPSSSARNPKTAKRDSGEEREQDYQFQPLSELASVVRSLGEGLLKIEHMKMEMMKETERKRMDMEMKRTEMILDSQRYMADVLADAFYSNKKAKRLQSPEI